jgi:hypothetical protein
VGLLLFWPLASLSLPLYAVTVIGTVCVAIWAAEQMCQLWNTRDDGRIVVDEIAGQLVTLARCFFWVRAHSFSWVVTGFVCSGAWMSGSRVPCAGSTRTCTAAPVWCWTTCWQASSARRSRGLWCWRGEAIR